MERLDINCDDTTELSSMVSNFDAIIRIAAHAALAVDGVAELEGGWTKRLANALSKDKVPSGIVVVAVEDNRLILQINVVMKYGVRIPEVSWNLQEQVKRAIEGEVGVQIGKVNIFVSGIKEVS